MQKRTVWMPGSSVWIGVAKDRFEKIPATISAVLVDHGGTWYRCIWWDGRTRKEELLAEYEVFPDGDPPIMQIGFR